jgi:hypothetical protein
MLQPAICDAIRQRRLLRFRYKDHLTPTTVEPYVCGDNLKDHAALRAWLVEGETHSTAGKRWRMYLVDEMKDLEVLGARFDRNQPDYEPNDEGFNRIVCRA